MCGVLTGAILTADDICDGVEQLRRANLQLEGAERGERRVEPAVTLGSDFFILRNLLRRLSHNPR